MRAILNAALTLAVVLGMVFAVWSWLRELPYRGGPDYSAMPPAQAFEEILGYPPPPGVTNMRVAGNAPWRFKDRAWMSFSATDSALRSLAKVSGGGSRAGSDTGSILRVLRQSSAGRNAEDMHRVGWEEVERIVDPQVYMFGTVGDGVHMLWAGWLIVDRKRHRAFLQLDGD